MVPHTEDKDEAAGGGGAVCLLSPAESPAFIHSQRGSDQSERKVSVGGGAVNGLLRSNELAELIGYFHTQRRNFRAAVNSAHKVWTSGLI